MIQFRNWLEINESLSSLLIKQAVKHLDSGIENPGIPSVVFEKLKNFFKEVAKRWSETDHSLKAQAVIYLGAAAAAGITIPMIISYLNKVSKNPVKNSVNNTFANLASKVASYITKMNLDASGFAVIEKVKPIDIIKAGVEGSRQVAGAKDSMVKFQKDLAGIAKTGKGFEDLGLELYRDLMEAPTADVLIVPDDKLDKFKDANTLAFCSRSGGQSRSLIVMRKSLYSRLPNPEIKGDMGELTQEGKNVFAHEARHACQRSGKKTTHFSEIEPRDAYMNNPYEMGVRLAALKALNEPYWFRMAFKKTVPEDLLTGKVSVGQVPYIDGKKLKKGKIKRQTLITVFNRFLNLDEKHRFKLIMDKDEFFKEFGRLLENAEYFEDVNRRSFLKAAAATAGLAGLAGSLKAQDKIDAMPAHPLDVIQGMLHFMLKKANDDAYEIIEYYQDLRGFEKEKNNYMQELMDNYDKVVAAPMNKKDLV